MEIDKDEITDVLDIASNEIIKKAINLDITEKILYSNYIQKINEKGKIQNRIFLITSKAIYNIVPEDPSILKSKLNVFFKIMKRAIPLDKIEAITVSSYYLSYEFVIHEKNNYDYRFDGKFEYTQGKEKKIEDRRDKLLLCLARGLEYYFNLSLPIVFKEDTSLEKYTTKEIEWNKEKIKRTPTDIKHELTPDDLADGVQYVIKSIKKNTPLSDLAIDCDSFSLTRFDNIDKNKSIELKDK